MATKRLGRGLEALIRPPEKQDAPGAGVSHLPVKLIKTNPHQPRKSFDEDALLELTASIKEKGVITPVTVRKNEEHFILIAGERRLRATKLANLKKIPAYIIEVTDEAEMMEVALIENIQRENLNAIEEAEAYAVLQGQFNLSQNAIAQAVGKKRVTITNALRLLRLPPDIKKSLRSGKITAGHGRAILAMKTTPAMLTLWQKILGDNLSVRAAEIYTKEKSATQKVKKLVTKNPTIRKIEDELISVLGTKVKLRTKGKKGGSIIIEYYSNDDLERVLDLLKTLE